MIAHALTRRRGGARVTPEDFARWRDLAAAGAPATLPQVAIDAMTDPAGVTGVVDVTFELESNRNGRGVTSTVIGAYALYDTTMMSLADLTSGVRRPTAGALCVADASYADASTVWPAGAEIAASVADEFPVGVASAAFTPNRAIVKPRPTGTGVESTWATTTYPGAVSSSGVVGIDASDVGRLAPAGEGLVYRANLNGATSTVWDVHPTDAGNYGGVYRTDALGIRVMTVVAKIAAGAAVTVTPVVTGKVGATVVSNAGTPVSVPAAVAGQPFTRLVMQVTISTLTLGVNWSVAMPRLRITVPGGSTTRVEVADVQLYAGAEPRSDRSGLLVALPGTALGGGFGSPLGYELQLTGTRRINRIEVIGHEGTIPSSVFVEQWNGAAWVLLAMGGTGGVLSFPTVTTTGLRVWIEEVIGYGGLILVDEIDAQYVAQLDGDSGVVSASVEFSREADPAQVVSPFGNYQTGKLDLELDNTTNAWSPEANANLDVGHRITAAFGVRYTNQLANPRADVSTAGWAKDPAQAGPVAVYDRTVDPFDLGERAPADIGSAHRIRFTASNGQLAFVYSDAIPCSPGDVFDLSGWVRMILANPAAAGATWIALSFHSSLTGLSTAQVSQTFVAIASAATGDQWKFGQSAPIVAPASTVCVRVEFAASPQSSPSMTGLFTGARLRKFEGGVPVEYETLLPAGVFYSDPFDWGSDDETVQITATDKLGRLGDVALSESVRFGQSVGGIVNDLASQGLDLGVDQVAVSSVVAPYVIPYASPANNLGTYLADLAKSVAGCLYLDALERLVIDRRDGVTTTPIVAELRGDNALIRYQRPAGYDLTAARVNVTATPLVPHPAGATEVWAMPSGGFQVPAGSSKTLIATYSSSPVISPSLSGAIADLGGYTLTPTYYADRAEILVTNPNGTTLTLADLRVQGTTLDEQTMTTTVSDAASLKRYGNRAVDVSARLIQTQAQLEAVAAVLLDGFKALDSSGNRRLPDLILDAMGLLHIEGGDRVLVKNPRTGLGEPFAVLGRTLAYSGSGEILATGVRVRQSPDVIFMIADLHLADDVSVAGA